MAYDIQEIALHETAQQRYLNYAMSVITSRALPDVRDGLKPVQRRILYAMFQNLGLRHTAKHRKSAAVIGEVMAKYHPHGDQSIYDAMVRQAQDFSMRYPLVDGQGNFGSLDGDNAAAMRYTEARMTELAEQLLEEIRKDTVAFQRNYDNTTDEPIVLPAQIPNLLINGATGIAVGMATNIPPHNLGEVVGALLKLVDRPHASVEELVREHIKGPDFPTAGVLLEGEDDIVKMYTKGQGSLTLRSDWEVEPQDDGTARIVITSVPYTVNKATLVEKIAEHIQDKKLPQVVHVRDESTEDVRVVLELKRGAGHDAVMAYLFKHTPLQTRFHVNLTCLVPAEGQEKCAPAKLNLKQILWHFLEFRMDVFTRRTQFDLGALERRIHILEGYELVFNALDEALELIRSADGKRDAQDKLIERFELSEVQSQRVVELPLYRLAKLEIEDIRAELREKRAQAEKLKDLLGNERKRWSAIKRELRSIQSKYADVRRTRVGGNVREFAYSEENYIVDEEYRVLVSKDGWIKRQKSYSDLSTIRVRDHDEVRYAMPGRTRGVVTFFSNMGRAYTMRVDDVPSTSGYGDPVQAFFDFDDGEKVVGVLTDHEDVRRRYDTAQLGDDALAELELGEDSEPSVVQLFAISSAGQSVRFSYSGFDEPSNRKGRIFMRLDDGDAIVNVEPGLGQEYVCLATREGRGLTFVAREISYYKGVAKGVRAVTLVDGDDVLDFTLVRDPQTGLEVETNRGAMHTIQPSLSKFAPSSRGNKGRWVIKRGHLIRAYRPAVEIITVAQEEEERASGERSAGAASEA